MSVNADNKFQLHIFPIDRVIELNVQLILAYKFNVRMVRDRANMSEHQNL